MKELTQLLVTQILKAYGTATSADDPELLYHLMASSDMRLETLVLLAKQGDSHALEYLVEVRRRVQMTHKADKAND